MTPSTLKRFANTTIVMFSEFALVQTIWVLNTEINASAEEGEIALAGNPMVEGPFLLPPLSAGRTATTLESLYKAALGFIAWDIVNLTVGVSDIWES